MVRLLLSYGADVNALDNAMNTALHLACQSPQRRLIAFYLAMVSSTHCSLYVCLSVCLSTTPPHRLLPRNGQLHSLLSVRLSVCLSVCPQRCLIAF